MTMWAKLPWLLAVLMAGYSAVGTAQTKRKTTSKSSTRKVAATPKPTPESRIPTTARRLKPSGAQAAFIVTDVQAGAAPGTGKRSSTTANSDPEKFKKLFDRAIVYSRDVGARIVLNSKEGGIDYVEIRGNGKGFGVNTADGKATLLVNNYKFPRVKGGITSGTIEIDVDAELSTSGNDKKAGSRMKLKAAFIEDVKNTRVFNVPEEEAEEPKKEVKSDTEAAAEGAAEKKPAKQPE